MPETITLPDGGKAESPHIPRPETDHDPGDHLPKLVLSEHVRGTSLLDKIANRSQAILDNFARKDMPGRQRDIQDCVNKILAKLDPSPAAG